MKRITTLGLALGAAIAFAGSAQAQIKMGVAGPLTGPNAAFGAQLKNGTGPSVIFHDAWQWLRERPPSLPSEEKAIAGITNSVGGAAKFLADRAGGLVKGVFNFVVSLGLTLVRKLTDQIGGNLEAPGPGQSAYTVSFPLNPPPQMLPPPPIA